MNEVYKSTTFFLLGVIFIGLGLIFHKSSLFTSPQVHMIQAPIDQTVLGSQKEPQFESRININKATLQELESLPGVGPKTAEKIINGRPYTAVDELISKKTITKSIFEKIKDRLSVN